MGKVTVVTLEIGDCKYVRGVYSDFEIGMGKAIKEIHKFNNVYDTHELKGLDLKECYLVTKSATDDKIEVIYAIKEMEVRTSF